jgi:hypothetical protein
MKGAEEISLERGKEWNGTGVRLKIAEGRKRWPNRMHVEV